VLVCGSTVDGEEPLLLKAFENVLVAHPHAVMLLAPRHPERFDTVAALLTQMEIPFWRRTRWGQSTSESEGMSERRTGEPLAGSVLLVDTIGELAALYALADVAFVGGSLVPHENFRDIVSLFQSRNAVRIVGMAELPLTLMELLANPAERAALGRRAAETMRSQTGATRRTVEALETLVAQSTANPALRN
jgi:3-deoxy-D-manno-octulosonic-acid transferase